MPNQVQGSCPLGSHSDHQRPGFYPQWMPRLQMQGQRALASSAPCVPGECQAWGCRAVFSCGGPGIWKMLAGKGQHFVEEDQRGIAKVLTFLPPHPPAPPPSKSLPHVLPLSQKIPLSHISQPAMNKGHQCSVPAVFSKCRWLCVCPEGILGYPGFLVPVSEGRLIIPKRERSCPVWGFVLMFQRAVLWGVS